MKCSKFYSFCSLIINDCLDSGTQIPFIKRAKDEDYGVIVLNTNDNYRIIDQTITYIRVSNFLSQLKTCYVHISSRWGNNFLLLPLYKFVHLSNASCVLQGSDRPEHHIRYVWDHFIRHAKAKYISFIAHSYGGVAFFDLASNRYEEMKSRVSGVAFTDSVHALLRTSPHVVNWIHNVSISNLKIYYYYFYV